MTMPYFHSIIFVILVLSMIGPVLAQWAFIQNTKSGTDLAEIYDSNEWKMFLVTMLWIMACDALVILFVDSGYLSHIHLSFLAYGALAPFWFLGAAKKLRRLYFLAPTSTIPSLAA